MRGIVDTDTACGIHLAFHTNTAFSKFSLQLSSVHIFYMMLNLLATQRALPSTCNKNNKRHLTKNQLRQKLQAGQEQLTELLRSWWRLLEFTASWSDPLSAAVSHLDIPWNIPKSPPIIPEVAARRSRRFQSRGQKGLCKWLWWLTLLPVLSKIPRRAPWKDGFLWCIHFHAEIHTEFKMKKEMRADMVK